MIFDKNPIWQPIEKSYLEEVTMNAYYKVTNGKKTKTQVEHGGLEPAVFIVKKPDLEQASIGPTIKDPHSVKERVKIDTVLPFYNWLSEILKMLN